MSLLHYGTVIADYHRS